MTGWRWVAVGGLFLSSFGTVFVWALCKAAGRADRWSEEHPEGYLDRVDRLLKDDQDTRDRRPR